MLIRSGRTLRGLMNEAFRVIHSERAPVPAHDRSFGRLRDSERLCPNDANGSIRLFDSADHSVFFIDRSKCPVRLVQPDESLLLSANSAKSLLLCGRAKPALFNHDDALSPSIANDHAPGSANDVSQGLANNDIAAQAETAVGCRPCADTGPSQGAD
jgi:hypothetical protein